MSPNLIYIINNKLHNKKYKLYTFLFYALIMHTYYCLYINLSNNNYISIVIYFALLLAFYIKFKKFSYIISYIYLLFSVYFLNANVKENLSLRERVRTKRDTVKAELENTIPEPNNSVSPCEEYIMNRITTQTELNLSPPASQLPANTPKSGKINTTLNIPAPVPDISTQLVE